MLVSWLLMFSIRLFINVVLSVDYSWGYDDFESQLPDELRGFVANQNTGGGFVANQNAGGGFVANQNVAAGAVRDQWG